MSAELGKHFQPAELEGKWYRFWDENGFFHANPEADGEPYSIVIPPPNITGRLHMGHALNNTLQDVLIRWNRMRGRNTLWMPGTDHAGIATQNRVEKELREQGVDRRDLGREPFVQRVWEWREEYGNIILSQLRQMGCSCDWPRTRFTMDAGLSRAVRLVFKRLYDEGLIYKGSYLVNWCPKDQTALSDDEVEYREVNGHLWHIRYPLEDGSGHITVATTRPETMLGDTAVAYNPEDPRYRNFAGKRAILPLLDRPIPFIADDHVDPEFGTGLVKVTPAHDPNDYEMGKRHDLETINILNVDGTINANGGPYERLDRFEARRRVVADLEAKGLLEKVEDHVHQVGHSYRSDAVVEPYISEQWFVSMQPLAEQAVRAVEEGRTRFVPRSWENTYFHWVRNVRDWCISRQLWWGHQIPVWYCDDCAHRTVSEEERVDKCEKCGSAAIHQDPDVLDTWFSSALWPFSTMGWPEETPELRTYYPTAVLLTAHEIIFFWVARMIIMGLKFMGEVPFHDVYIHAMVFDEKTRKKMSKSLGNTIDPIEMIEKYGTDAMRMTVGAYAVKGANLYLSEERFEGYQNFINKFWNSARFVLMNVADLPPEELARPLEEHHLALEDRWILSALARTIARADASLSEYEFDQFVHHLYHFVWGEYCDWYVELTKSRLYDKSPEHAPARRAAQVVLLTVLENLCRLMHPIAPFVTEEVWQTVRESHGSGLVEVPGAAGIARSLARESVMVAPWPEAKALGGERPEDETAMERLMDAIRAIRKIRSEMTVPPSSAVDVTVRCDDAAGLDFFRLQTHHFVALARTGSLEFTVAADGPEPGAVEAQNDSVAATAVAGGATFSVALPAELLDAERERLDKELERLDSLIARAGKKLENPQFVERAPEQVVQAERDRLSAAEKERAELAEKRRGLS